MPGKQLRVDTRSPAATSISASWTRFEGACHSTPSRFEQRAQHIYEPTGDRSVALRRVVTIVRKERLVDLVSRQAFEKFRYIDPRDASGFGDRCKEGPMVRRVGACHV